MSAIPKAGQADASAVRAGQAGDSSRQVDTSTGATRRFKRQNVASDASGVQSGNNKLSAKRSAQPESTKAKNTTSGGGRPTGKAAAKVRDGKKTAKKPNLFRRAFEYFKAVRLEIKRTTWPTRGEVLNMSIIVIFALIFFGVLIFILDQVMITLLNLYGQIFPDISTAGTALDASAVDATAGIEGTGAEGAGGIDTATATDAATETGAATTNTATATESSADSTGVSGTSEDAANPSEANNSQEGQQ
ncbi:MAG: preprotein translocase subunit SecE [Coriobacteriales bacterium]|jgi:preprotein translocase subunit SecE|nr:preprotein translocase subunit SecE [Coriobacteriales bacterium]